MREKVWMMYHSGYKIKEIARRFDVKVSVIANILGIEDAYLDYYD